MRLVGLTRGASDFVPTEQRSAGKTEAFYAFHPDERMVIQAALAPLRLTDPPITTYGMLPSYLLRGALESGAFLLGWEELELDSTKGRRRVYYTARLLAALYSSLVLVLVWVMGRRYFDERAAALAAAFVAFAAGAIQQAHFYIVDGLFVTLSLGAAWASLRALEGEQRHRYVLAGLLIGLTGAVRLNGLLLGLMLLIGYIAGGNTGGWERWRRLGQMQLWLAGIASVLVLLAVEPYLVTDPGRLWLNHSPEDFGFSLQVARGELLQPWVLVDWHTLPYVHYWTHLWPLVAGWPLTACFVGALGYVVWRRNRFHLLLVLWCVLYFAIIGGLVTKSVRYLIPLLPFLALFAGFLLTRLWERARGLGAATSVALVGYTAFYGIAFAGVYSVEDSRIQAGRWIEANLSPQTTIAVERGGFSVRPVISPQTYRLQAMEINSLFRTRGYITCTASRYYLERLLEWVDYIVLTDVNRHAQFTAVPDLYPAVASFYQHLMAGELGFSLKRRFKTYPTLLGVEFNDDNAEPSFLGYDHPAVFVFEKNDRFARDWSAWNAALEEDGNCAADGAIGAAAAAVVAGDLDGALARVREAQERHPEMPLIWLVEGFIHNRQGRTEEKLRADSRYLEGYTDASLMLWTSAMSLALLELDDLAYYILLDGSTMQFPEKDRRSMAVGYIYTARVWQDRADMERAAAVYKLTTEFYPRADVCNLLGQWSAIDGLYDEALHWWKMSLQINPAQEHIAARIAALEND